MLKAVIPAVDALVPPLATGRTPETPVVSDNPVQLESVPDDGVPSAPPLTTKAPADPVLTPRAVTTPVPVVTVDGPVPEPPPTTRALAVRAAAGANRPPAVLTALPIAVTTPVPVVVVAGPVPDPPPRLRCLKLVNLPQELK